MSLGRLEHGVTRDGSARHARLGTAAANSVFTRIPARDA